MHDGASWINRNISVRERTGGCECGHEENTSFSFSFIFTDQSWYWLNVISYVLTNTLMLLYTKNSPHICSLFKVLRTSRRWRAARHRRRAKKASNQVFSWCSQSLERPYASQWWRFVCSSPSDGRYMVYNLIFMVLFFVLYQIFKLSKFVLV